MKRTIRGIRVDLGYTQEEMSKLMGIKLETYKNYEQYQVRTPAKFLIDLADLAKVDDIRTIKIA